MSQTITLSEEAFAELQHLHLEANQKWQLGDWYPWRPSYSTLIEFLCRFRRVAIAESKEAALKDAFDFRPNTRRAGRPRKYVPETNRLIALACVRAVLMERGELRSPTPEEVDAYLADHEHEFPTKYSRKEDRERAMLKAGMSGGLRNVTNNSESRGQDVQSEVEPGRQLIP